MGETGEKNSGTKKARKRYYRKRADFFLLIDKIKLWPSRRGVLHGIKSFAKQGQQAEIVTHCNEVFVARNSKNSRAARWLRNNWSNRTCPACAVPAWKVEKYKSTIFNRHWGSDLQKRQP